MWHYSQMVSNKSFIFCFAILIAFVTLSFARVITILTPTEFSEVATCSNLVITYYVDSSDPVTLILGTHTTIGGFLPLHDSYNETRTLNSITVPLPESLKPGPLLLTLSQSGIVYSPPVFVKVVDGCHKSLIA